MRSTGNHVFTAICGGGDLHRPGDPAGQSPGAKADAGGTGQKVRALMPLLVQFRGEEEATQFAPTVQFPLS